MPRTPAWKEARRRLSAPERAHGSGNTLAKALQAPETTVLDLVDNLLNRGVVLNAEVILALADVDLVYLRLSALLSAADRVMDAAAPAPSRRRRT